MVTVADDYTPAARLQANAAIEQLAAGDIQEALATLEKLQALAPEASATLHLVGLAALRLDEPGKALEALQRAHELAPEVREHAEVLSILHGRLGRIVDSLYFQKLSLGAQRELGIPGLVPDWLGTFADAFQSINDQPLLKQAHRALKRGDYVQAQRLYQQEVEVDRESTQGWRGLARALLRYGKPHDGLIAGRTLLAVNRSIPADLALYGELLALAGRFDEAAAIQRRAARLAPEDPEVGFQLVRTLARRPGADPADAEAAMIAWGERFALPADAPAPAAPGNPGRAPLRLGVLTTQLASGCGLDLFVPALEQLDPREIELLAYAAGQTDSPLAKRLRGRARTWHDIGEIDDDTAGFVIRNDALDVLIDLDGPSRAERPLVFTGRPAPLVLSLYGTPGKAARALGFDGVLEDARALPVEDIGLSVRVEGGIAALPADLPPLDAPRRRTAPGGPVYGALAAQWQITPETVATWADLLAAVPDATLELDEATLGGAAAGEELLASFAPHLPPGRVAVNSAAATQADYVAGIDLLLDPLDNPYPDAAVAGLGLGLPVVTCRSRTRRASLLACWLERIGLGELAAADRESYVATAARAGTTEAARLADAIHAAVMRERSEGAASRARALAAALTAAVRGGRA